MLVMTKLFCEKMNLLLMTSSVLPKTASLIKSAECLWKLSKVCLATATARAQAEAMAIEGEAAVKQAELKKEAKLIEAKSKLQQQVAKQNATITHQHSLNELEITKAHELAQIEADKFKRIIEAVGGGTIEAVATAGPALQVELLASLGLKSFMITDGNSPINLFNTAQGLIGTK